jgi:hypothetical protein
LAKPKDLIRLFWDADADTIPVPHEPESAADFKGLRAAVVTHVVGSPPFGNPPQHRELVDLARTRHVDALARRELLLRRTPAELPEARARQQREIRDANECAHAYARLLAVLSRSCSATCLTVN